MALPASDKTKVADNLRVLDLGEVLPKTAEVKGDHLLIGGVDMVELAKKEGTALYVIDEADVRSRMQRYRSAFHAHYENSAVIFASKAFLNKAMVKIVDEEKLYLDVSGGGELACARAAGFTMERVLVHGNNKTPDELYEAISAGVGIIVVDSRIELARVSEIAGSLGKTQDVYMRITPGIEADTHEYVRTGCEDSKFGFTMREDFAFSCVKDFLEAPHVRLVGLHMHIGSQIFSLTSFREAIFVIVNLMARIKETYHHTMLDLDIGGGLGVAYLAKDKPTSIEDFAKCAASSVKEFCAEFGLKNPKLLCEPGRSLVANAGVTLYRVGVIKTLPQIRKYVAIDGGMSDNIRTALYHANYEAVIANKADMPRLEIVTLVGKHCESGDAVATDVSLQTPALGDIVCVFGTGAYNHTMASNYNGQVRPAIVFVKAGSARVVTRRETYVDLMVRDIG
jgi:diaminopimelate decarboxylase